ncbi:MAG: DUF1838 family protein [Rhodospirillaceae bacterium]|nr:DUF1838 family protein [Rhodospirillaceae bacterium]
MTILLESLVDRRGMFQWGAGALALASSAPRATMAAGGRSLDLNDPREHLMVYLKLNASTRPGDKTFLRYSGVTFGAITGTEIKPLYGMEGVVALKVFEPDGEVARMTFNEVGIFTDLATGEVIDRWANPYLERTVDVWHLRNGPTSLSINPRQEQGEGGFRLMRTHGNQPKGFYLPMTIQGDNLVVAVDVQARRPNPLDPAVWKLESTGPLVYSEHNTFRAKLADIVNPDLPAVDMFAAWHSHKQWRPWMLMGQQPGYIYNHLIVSKIASWTEAPKPVVKYAEKHFPDYMTAPAQWTKGQYQSDWDFFKRDRKPISAA